MSIVKRLEAVKESLKHKDKMTDEQLKQIKGKSAEEVLELMYPKEIPTTKTKSKSLL